MISVYRIIACVLIFAGCILAFLNKPKLAHQLNEWKLLPRPERLTELYFTENERLPSKYTPGKPQTLKFTIHNLEHQKTEYHYSLIALTTNKRQLLGKGSLTLEHNDAQVITRKVIVPPLDDHTEVSVSLAYNSVPLGKDLASPQRQSIHYWVVKSGLATGKKKGT